MTVPQSGFSQIHCSTLNADPSNRFVDKIGSNFRLKLTIMKSIRIFLGVFALAFIASCANQPSTHYSHPLKPSDMFKFDESECRAEAMKNCKKFDGNSNKSCTKNPMNGMVECYPVQNCTQPNEQQVKNCLQYKGWRESN